jgi:hypothetical protein
VLEPVLEEKVAENPLVSGVAVGVQERDRGDAEPLPPEAVDVGAQPLELQLLEDGAVGGEPLRDLDHVLVERLGLPHGQGEEIVALLGADPQRVAESPGDEEDDSRPLALEQGVRAPGRGQAQGEGRQRLSGRRPGHEARGEERGFLR